MKEFFAEEDLKASCSDLAENLPVADQDGYMVIDGVRGGTSRAWQRELKIKSDTIAKHVEKRNCPSIKGRLRGNIYVFYSEPSVREACADISHGMPRVKKMNFLILNGVRDSYSRA